MATRQKVSTQLNWRSLLNNRRYLLYGLMLSALSLSLVGFGVISQVQEIFKLSAQQQQEQLILDSLLRKSQQLTNLEKEVAFQQRQLVAAALPSKKPLLELLTGLNVVAGNNQVIFADFQLTPGEIASEAAELISSGTRTRAATTKRGSTAASSLAYSTLDVQLTIEGDFASVQGFITDVERLAPLTTIKSLSLKTKTAPEGVIEGSDPVEAAMVVNTYYFTKPLTATLTAPLPQLTAQDTAVLEEVVQYLYPTVTQQQQIVGGGLIDLFGISRNELGLSQ